MDNTEQKPNRKFALKVAGTENEFVYSGRMYGLTTTDKDRINYWNSWKDVKQAIANIERDWEARMETTKLMPEGWAEDYRAWYPKPEFVIIEILLD